MTEPKNTHPTFLSDPPKGMVREAGHYLARDRESNKRRKPNLWHPPVPATQSLPIQQER